MTTTQEALVLAPSTVPGALRRARSRVTAWIAQSDFVDVALVMTLTTIKGLVVYHLFVR